MSKAYMFRAYPTTEEQKELDQYFGAVRFVYNKLLEECIAMEKDPDKKLKVQGYAHLKDKNPWLKKVDSLALANAEVNLKKAFKHFFEEYKRTGILFTEKKLAHLAKIKREPDVIDRYAHPKFKSKKDNDFSYTTNNQCVKKKGIVTSPNTIWILDGKIHLPKIGEIGIKQHRDILKNSRIKNATISKSPSGKYYVSIIVEYDNQVLPVIPTSFIGLDLSLQELYVDSDNNIPAYPKFYRKSMHKLAILQQKQSKFKFGSSHRKKIRLRIAKLHEKIANQRLDFLHKQANKLVARYDCICIEDLDMREIAQDGHGKSVGDNGWGIFTRILDYKLEWSGKKLVKVDKYYSSSQLCSECGFQNHELKDYTIREWDCPKCRTHHDRDHNAAVNILNEGRKVATA